MTLITTRKKNLEALPESPARARRQSTLVWIVFLACCGLLLGIAFAGTPDSAPGAAGGWQLPPGFPTPAVPAGNPISAAQVALGRESFFEQRLPVSRPYSCASD